MKKIDKHTGTKIIKIILSVLILISLFFLTITFKNIFNIKTIKIYSKKKIKIDYLYNRNLLSTKTDEVRNLVIKENPEIKQIEISKKFPNTLIIKAEIDNPIASLYVDNGLFLLTENGKIIKKEHSINAKGGKKIYPRIRFYQKLNYYNYNRGDVVSFKDIDFCLKMLDFISTTLKQRVDAIDIRDTDMIVLKLRDEKEVLLNSKRSLKQQEYELKEILQEARGGMLSKIKIINLRFNKPIISF